MTIYLTSKLGDIIMMTLIDYLSQLKILDHDYNKNKNELMIKYATENSPLKIGDVATDHIGSIIVEQIKFTAATDDHIPVCLYLGQTLKKDGSQTKKKEKRMVYQGNLKK